MGILDFIFRPKKILLREAYEDAASEIETFLGGGGGEWDWDDFLSTSKPDEFLESVRSRCESVYDEFPSEGSYCNEEGAEVLRSLVKEVRERMNALPDEDA